MVAWTCVASLGLLAAPLAQAWDDVATPAPGAAEAIGRYAAGCVIYECLTGATPITAENQITLIAKLLEDTPIAPRVVNAEVPEALSDLVMRTLAKKADERPQSATELHDLLAAIG